MVLFELRPCSLRKIECQVKLTVAKRSVGKDYLRRRRESLMRHLVDEPGERGESSTPNKWPKCSREGRLDKVFQFEAVDQRKCVIPDAVCDMNRYGISNPLFRVCAHDQLLKEELTQQRMKLERRVACVEPESFSLQSQ